MFPRRCTHTHIWCFITAKTYGWQQIPDLSPSILLTREKFSQIQNTEWKENEKLLKHIFFRIVYMGGEGEGEGEGEEKTPPPWCFLSWKINTVRVKDDKI